MKKVAGNQNIFFEHSVTTKMQLVLTRDVSFLSQAIFYTFELHKASNGALIH